jgi:hypothetical protein
MTMVVEASGPVVGTSTGLHANKCWEHRRDKGPQLTPSYTPPEHNMPGVIHAEDVKYQRGGSIALKPLRGLPYLPRLPEALEE